MTMELYDLLMNEHRFIEKMINLMREEIKCIQKTGCADTAFIDTSADFIETYVHQTHHEKETLLFHGLSRKAMSEEDFMMMTDLIKEHDTENKIIEELINIKAAYENGNQCFLPLIVDKLNAIVLFYPQHIKKEENIFFPCSEKYFNQDELQTMLNVFRDFDKAITCKNIGQLKKTNVKNDVITTNRMKTVK